METDPVLNPINLCLCIRVKKKFSCQDCNDYTNFHYTARPTGVTLGTTYLCEMMGHRKDVPVHDSLFRVGYICNKPHVRR